jgi:quercetin dioxygenase-like cupin family protein
MQHDRNAILTEGRLVITPGGDKDPAALPWNNHPAFTGVRLKHLVTGADTNGALSCHLVRIDPGCHLKNHVHEGQWELHEVVAGSGTAQLDGRKADYLPGVVAVVPKGTPHEILAGDEGLCIFAKFFPALL